MNRALKARLEAYRTSETGGALRLPGGAHRARRLVPGGGPGAAQPGRLRRLQLGHGDLANALSDRSGKTVADARLRTDAELQASGARDARYLAKVDSGFSNTLLDLRSDLRFSLYLTKPFYGSGQKASPIPVIRNEELILLRSEARWFTGDRAGATADLNFIRQNSGNLAPIAQPANDDAYITALLKEAPLLPDVRGVAPLDRPPAVRAAAAAGSHRRGAAGGQGVQLLPLPDGGVRRAQHQSVRGVLIQRK